MCGIKKTHLLDNVTDQPKETWSEVSDSVFPVISRAYYSDSRMHLHRWLHKTRTHCFLHTDAQSERLTGDDFSNFKLFHLCCSNVTEANFVGQLSGKIKL